MNPLELFSAWEPIIKARKAKGLSAWAKLQPIADKLQGKGIDSITFTCAHPSHSGQPVKHMLGSIEGNLHFLMGYGNPNFHLAPYHWQVIDPNLTDEEAQEVSKLSHPSNPALWKKAGLEDVDEGDQADGEGHKSTKAGRVKRATDKKRSAEKVKGISPTGSYSCFPSEGLVMNDKSGHTYSWDLVRGTFFSAQNPDVTEAMEEAAVQENSEGVTYSSGLPDAVKALSKSMKEETFDPNVWPLIKSRVPKPGHVIHMYSVDNESIYGVITSRDIQFFDRESNPVEIPVFDRLYKSFDITRDGNIPPYSLFLFLTKHFNVNNELLAEVNAGSDILEKGIVTCISGEPSPGYDNVSSSYKEATRNVVQDGDWVRVLPETV